MRFRSDSIVRADRVAVLSVLTGLALILSYLESLIPVFFGFPGMKLGLTNILIVFALYRFSAPEALIINIMRILLSGILFGNPYSIAYSMAGGILSFVIMRLLQRTRALSVTGVSMAGGIFHNVGQILAAVFVVQNYILFHYLPLLLITGTITGFFIGLLSDEMLRHCPKITS